MSGRLRVAVLGGAQLLALFTAALFIGFGMGGDSIDRLLFAFLLMAGGPVVLVLGALLGVALGRVPSRWGFAQPRSVIASILLLALLVAAGAVLEKAGAFRRPTPAPRYAQATLAELAEAVKGRASGPRADAIGELCRRCDPRSADLLVGLVREAGPGQKHLVIACLGRLREPAAVTPLVMALAEADTGTRVSAILALGAIGDDRAVEPLVSQLEDEGLAGVTADSLGSIGSPRAIGPLVSTLGRQAAAGRRGAVERILGALRKLTGQDFGRDVAAWKRWWDAQSRR